MVEANASLESRKLTKLIFKNVYKFVNFNDCIDLVDWIIRYNSVR